MPRNSARMVKVTVSADGEVLRTRDPQLSEGAFFSRDPRPWIDRAFPQNGKVYGFSIEPYLKGKIRRPKYVQTVDAALNDATNTTDRQTVQVQGAHFVKLDVGYWGNYLVQSPQRDFGLIEGENVWLCSFVGSSDPGNDSEILPVSGTLADQLVQALAACKPRPLYVRFVSHATVPPNPEASVPEAKKLYVCFPDMHLPEQWPDLYPSGARLIAGRRRAGLRRLLRQCQCKTGASNDSWLSVKETDLIQSKLDAWTAGGTQTITIKYVVSTSWVTPDDPESPPMPSPNWVTDTYSPAELMAEKAHLDREIQATSTWYYGGTPVPGSKVTTPPLNSDDANPPVDCTSDDPVSSSPAPAVDLANLLFVIKDLREKVGSEKLTIVQVGDLYELWMNREFIYKDFPVIAADEIGQITRDGAVASTATIALLNTEMYNDAFQLRADANWCDGGPPHVSKRYPFHAWDRSEQYLRHDTQGSVAGDKLARLQAILKARIEAVHAWSAAGPAPENDDRLIEPLRKWVAGQPGRFQRVIRRGESETRWNHIVLQLFNVELKAERIHGNHDGYRSDTKLLPDTSDPAACKMWFSKPGVWVEHGHRWDYYNRDGVAMGAGMTNAVYYHNQEMIAASGGIAGKAFRQEQAFFQPGAAQWYLLINYGSAGWFDGSIQKFGAYVSGHTHAPDLIRVFFELANSDQAADWLRQRKQDTEDAAAAAQRWVVREGDLIGKTIRDKARGISEWVSKLWTFD